MIFRWSIWGKNKNKNLELLAYSILSFKKQFGKNHQYLVFADSSKDIKLHIGKIAEVFEFTKENQFNIESITTWKKWCPAARIDVNKDEVYIDSDVFLVNYPKEIYDFLDNKKYKFAILDEFKGQHWQHGSMHKKASPNTPFVNAGLFIQKAGADITKDLLAEFEWWKNNINKENRTHHDEQGALAIALTKYLLNDELYILPKDKYLLIGENENTELNTIEDITLFHAVYPSHPAFYKFKDSLTKLLYE